MTTSASSKKQRSSKSTKEQPPPPKSLAARMAEAALAGDPEQVVREYQTAIHDCEYYFPDFLRELRTAMQTATSHSPEATIKFLMNRILIFDGLLLVRAQNCVEKGLQRLDRSMPQSTGEIPEDIANIWLPRVAKLEDSVKSTCRLYSQIMHVLELAQAKGIESKNLIAFAQPPPKEAVEDG